MCSIGHIDILQTAYETLGQLDYVIVNHAYLPKAAAWDASSDNVWNLHTAIDVNVKSSALLLAHALPHLIATKGNVGVVNSMMGKLEHNIPNCMKEVTWLKLCISTNGHWSAALWRLSFILPPVFVHAAVIRSWKGLRAHSCVPLTLFTIGCCCIIK